VKLFRRKRRNLDGVGPPYQKSRHRPPGSTATAESARGSVVRADLPGPPGDIHTARNATDTWPGTRPSPPSSARLPGPKDEAAPESDEGVPAGGGDASG
jgi:hypothetical protein